MGQNKNIAIAAIVAIVLALVLIAWRMFKPPSVGPVQPGVPPTGKAQAVE